MNPDPLTLSDLRRMALDIELRMEGFDFFRVDLRVPSGEGTYAGLSFEASGEKYRRIRPQGAIHIVLPKLPSSSFSTAGFDTVSHDLFPDDDEAHWKLEEHVAKHDPKKPLIEVRNGSNDHG